MPVAPEAWSLQARSPLHLLALSTSTTPSTLLSDFDHFLQVLHVADRHRHGFLVGAPPRTPARSLAGTPTPRAAPSQARRARLATRSFDVDDPVHTSQRLDHFLQVLHVADRHRHGFLVGAPPRTPARSLAGTPTPRAAPSQARRARLATRSFDVDDPVHTSQRLDHFLQVLHVADRHRHGFLVGAPPRTPARSLAGTPTPRAAPSQARRARLATRSFDVDDPVHTSQRLDHFLQVLHVADLHRHIDPSAADRRRIEPRRCGCWC